MAAAIKQTIPRYQQLAMLSEPLSLQQRQERQERIRRESDTLRALKPGPDELEAAMMTSDCDEPLRIHTMRHVDLLGAPELTHDMLLYLDGHEHWASMTPHQRALMELWLLHPQGYVALQAEQQGKTQGDIGVILHRHQSQISRYLQKAHRYVDAREAYWGKG
jgi:hypothetical protein